MHIYLSPSDQWSNIATSGHSEAYHCSKIADACAKYLREYGYTVTVGNNSTEETYPQRVVQSNSLKCDLHIPIHTNAGGGSGCEVYTYTGYSSNKYAVSIYNQLSALTPTSDRGIKETANLYEITETIAMCVYIECEFHDNASTEQWIDNNIDNIGKAIAEGVAKADGKTVSQPSQNGSGETLYKVQVGAFKVKENAEKLANELKAKGYSVYITNG